MHYVKRAIPLTALLLAFAADVRAVTIDWTPVGNPGNAADATVMSDGTTGYGSVPYAYNIDKYDVTNSQYVEFLNAKDSTGADPLHLFDANSEVLNQGISFNAGNVSGSKYSTVSGDANHPVNNVTWYTRFDSTIG